MDRDAITIPINSLTPLARKTFRPDVLEYHVKVLVGRGRNSDDKLREIIVRREGDVIILNGPMYNKNDEEYLIEGSVYANWKYLYENYFTNPSFINGLCAIRIVSVNPLTIYQKLLEMEEKNNMITEVSNKRLVMSRMIIKPTDITSSYVRKPTFVKEPFEPVKKPIERLKLSSKVQQEGHMMFTIYDSDLPGQSEWKEGPLNDEIPAYIQVNDELDYPNGMIMNIFNDLPFYAYNHVNLYPRMEDLNRMIESGMQIVYLEDDSLETLQTYMEFMKTWSIPVIDHVTPRRLEAAGLKFLTSIIKGVSDVKPFLVIRRPQEMLHNSAWAGICEGRRRGLVGIPWVTGEEFAGVDLKNPQPDDGFLTYWVREGVSRKMSGKDLVQVFFPVVSMRTKSEVRKLIIKPMERVLGRELKETWYPEQMVMGVYLKNSGEWLLLKSLCRKHL